MKNIILKGYYGRDNFGDEIMLDLIVSYIKNEYPSLKLQIMNSNPEMLKKKYKIDTPEALITGAYGRSNLLKRITTIVRADCYIVGGGTIITDKHSSLHLLEYYVEFLLRKLLKKPSVFISIGATRFKHSWTKILCKMIINSSDLCMVRDIESYDYLKKICCTKKIVQTGDLVLLAFDRLNNNGICKIVNNKKIGFCVMPYYESLYKKPELDKDLAKKIASIIDKLSCKGYEINLIPIQYGYNNTLDYKFSKQVQFQCSSQVRLFECIDNKEKMERIEEMDFIISMRLHAILFAISKNIKTIAINHNEKIDSCMKTYNLENQCVTMDNLMRIPEMIDTLTNKNCDKIIDAERKKAEKNFAYLATILDKVVNDER